PGCCWPSPARWPAASRSCSNSAAPTVRARYPVRSAVGLFHSKWWTVGWLVALGAWLLHVGALSLASLSSVQAVISGGLVFLAIIAERYSASVSAAGSGPACWSPQSVWASWDSPPRPSSASTPRLP